MDSNANANASANWKGQYAKSKRMRNLEIARAVISGKRGTMEKLAITYTISRQRVAQVVKLVLAHEDLND